MADDELRHFLQWARAEADQIATRRKRVSERALHVPLPEGGSLPKPESGAAGAAEGWGAAAAPREAGSRALLDQPRQTLIQLAVSRSATAGRNVPASSTGPLLGSKAVVSRVLDPKADIVPPAMQSGRAPHGAKASERI